MNNAILEKKKEVVAAIQESIEGAPVTVFVDFRGLSFANLNRLRNELRAVDASVSVFKNTLTRIAVRQLDVSYPEDLLMGPTAVVTSGQDLVRTAKVAVDFAKQFESVQLKGGILNGAVVDQKTLEHLASLPGRDQLIAMSVGAIKAPITKFVRVLKNPLNNLVFALVAIKDKKQEVNNG